MTSEWPRAAIFDCDGLLADTADCWNQAYHQAARALGGALNGVDLGVLNGAAVPDAASYLAGVTGLPITASALTDSFESAIVEGEVTAMPGAARLLISLTGHVAIAVASNAPAGVATSALRLAGLADLAPLVLSAEHVPRPKPAPDVYLHACRTLEVDPSDAIALEDSAAGAAAAAAAGLTVIVVPSEPGARRYADLVVPRLDDVRVLELFGGDARRR